MSEHELWNELGNVYFLFGSYDGAVYAYNRAIALNPESGEPYSNLAQTYVQMGHYGEAVKFYQQGILLLTDAHEKASSLHKLGDVYLHLKEYPQAVEAFQQAEGLITEIRQAPEVGQSAGQLLHCPAKEDPQFYPSVSSQSVEALSASMSGMESLPFIEELTPWWFDGQNAPDEDPEPNLELWVLDKSGVTGPDDNIIFTEPLRWDLTRESQTVTVELEPESSTVTQTDAMAVKSDQNMFHTERETESMYAAPESTTLGSRPDSQEQRVVELETVLTNPAPVAVITHASEVMTETPDFTSPNMTDPEAIQYEDSVELPVVDMSQVERTAIQAEIEKFKRVLVINPRNAFAWDTLGENYKALGQYDDALHAFQEAVRLDSMKAFYFHHLGLVYSAMGRVDDAIAAFERVIDIDPNHSLAHATLGGYYRKNGKEELAHAHIEKARNLLANDENEYNRACLEAIRGNTDRSLELLEIALKNKQTYVNWARKDPDLDFVRSDPRFRTLLAKYATRASNSP